MDYQIETGHYVDSVYVNYKPFHKHNGKTYPSGSKFFNNNGALMNEDGFMCLVDSQKSHDCMCGNDDGMGELRGKIINDINECLYHFVSYECKEDQLEALYNTGYNRKYIRHVEPDDGPWLWNTDFYIAPISDLQYIRKVLLEIRQRHLIINEVLKEEKSGVKRDKNKIEIIHHDINNSLLFTE